MISVTLANEIADKMAKLEVTEKCLGNISDMKKSCIVVETYKGRFEVVLEEGYYEKTEDILKTIVKNHKEALEELNKKAIQEAQGEKH